MSKPLKIFGVKLKDENKLLESQSGGAFSLIAEYFLAQGAVVYGVGQKNNIDAEYMRVESIDELIKLKGSKYVQAKTNDVFNKVKKDLTEGKIVLFSGTPCTVMALKLFSERLENVNNLYTVDLVCHGVPSPKVYAKYIEYWENTVGSKVKKFIFRDKNRGGWHQHVEKIIFENEKEVFSEEYTQLFYTNLPIRPSCGNCGFSNMNRVGDFTVGDFWGVNITYPDFDDPRGVSLVFCNSKRSVEIFEKLKDKIDYIETDEEHSALQPNLKASSYIPKQSGRFWKDFNKKGVGYCIKKWSPIGGLLFKIKRKLLKLIGAW